MTKTGKSNHFVSLTILIIIIGLIGLLAIYNASVIEGFNTFNDRFYFVKQQGTWFLLGLILFLIISRLNPALYKKIAAPVLIISLILMALAIVPGLGLKLQGARRWLALGPIRFQPSELLKVGLVLYLSVWFNTKRTVGQFLTIMGVSLGLVMLQSDLGTAAVVASICFGLYFLSGSPMKQVVTIVGLLLLAASIFIFTSPYRLQRLHTFIDPTADTLGRSYHINQVILGLGSGGFFGVGLGRSRQKYSYLPEATTDSIFAILGEETGFVGGIFLIAVLLGLCLLAMKIAKEAPDQHRRLIAAGIGILFTAQTFVNLGSMVALIPLTGIPLPLISYGGSSLVSNFISLGILASIARSL